MAILNWRDHPRLRFVDFPPPFLTKGSVYIASDKGDSAWISDGTTYLQLYPDTNLVPQEYTWAALPVPFSTFGPPTNVGQVKAASDAGNAEFVADGTRWRPRGGRQVIAIRGDNPVTVQSLIGEIAETIGPFPGGLVRAGMRLEIDTNYRARAVGTGTRNYVVRIGNSLPVSGNDFIRHEVMINSLFTLGRASNMIATSDGGANNSMGIYDGLTYGFGNYDYPPTLNFSAPWYVQILLQSTAETAVNISSATWSGGIATFNTSTDHTLAVGDKTVIDSVTPSGWNIPAGAIVLSVPTSTQFTVALAANPGAYTSGGTSSRISNVISQSYVLELVG